MLMMAAPTSKLALPGFEALLDCECVLRDSEAAPRDAAASRTCVNNQRVTIVIDEALADGRIKG